MYTDTNGDLERYNDNGQGSERAGELRGTEETVHDHTHADSVGEPRPLGNSLGYLSERLSREDRAWLSTIRQTDQSPGGIVSRLLAEKIDRLGEVRGRLEIVNQRKAEYEEKITQLEREISEIRAIAEELRPDSPPVS